MISVIGLKLLEVEVISSSQYATKVIANRDIGKYFGNFDIVGLTLMIIVAVDVEDGGNEICAPVSLVLSLVERFQNVNADEVFHKSFLSLFYC